MVSPYFWKHPYYTGWLIRILIMVYYNPLYTPNNQGFFHCSPEYEIPIVGPPSCFRHRFFGSFRAGSSSFGSHVSPLHYIWWQYTWSKPPILQPMVEVGLEISSKERTCIQLELWWIIYGIWYRLYGAKLVLQSSSALQKNKMFCCVLVFLTLFETNVWPPCILANYFWRCLRWCCVQTCGKA